jgi:hypothetical protein|nr:MAG TPA: hypothetical protein [Caudoviricetes sp.]
MGIFNWKQPDLDDQIKMQKFATHKYKEVMVGDKKFKVRGLRLGAYDYIVDKLLIRDIINPDTAKKEMIAIMKNDASIPYKVAAAGVLNNYWFFEIIPFARRIYAWWLSRHYDHKELTPLIEAIVEGANVSDFFTNTIRLAFLIDTTATLSKKDAMKLSLDAKSAHEDLSKKISPNSEEI